MDRNEYNKLLAQLPEHLIKEYGFNPPFDYSKYKCIHTDEYDYYPELYCCIVDDIPIVWTDNDPWVTPEDPEILAGFKDWAERRTQDTIALIGISRIDRRLSCTVYEQNQATMDHIKNRKFASIPFVEGDIYYMPSEIDLLNNPQMLLIAKCLFTAQKYEPIYIIPEKNVPASKWLDGK